MTNKSKAKGTAWETALVNWFRSKSGPWHAERLTLSGANDEGDLLVTAHGIPFVVEAKAEQRIDLSSYVKEAEVEARNYAKARGLDRVPGWQVIVKRRGRPVGDAYVVITLDEFYRQVEGL